MTIRHKVLPHEMKIIFEQQIDHRSRSFNKHISTVTKEISREPGTAMEFLSHTKGVLHSTIQQEKNRGKPKAPRSSYTHKSVTALNKQTEALYYRIGMDFIEIPFFSYFLTTSQASSKRADWTKASINVLHV